MGRKKIHYIGLICGIDLRHRDGAIIQFETTGIINKINCKGCQKIINKMVDNEKSLNVK